MHARAAGSRSFGLASALPVCSSWWGINIVFYYGATLWQAVGFSESDALRINVLSGCLSIGGCLLALALIDRVGRKPLLAVGSAVHDSDADSHGPVFCHRPTRSGWRACICRRGSA